MKRLFSIAQGLFIALMFAIYAGQANAITVSQLGTGLLVPSVIHNGAGVDTLVGITNGYSSPVIVYWTFFDVNGNPVTNSNFTIPSYGFYPFDWKDKAASFANQEGYLVFTVGDGSGNIIFGNFLLADAFLVDTTAKDAAWVPVLTLNGPSDYKPGINLNSMGPDSIKKTSYSTHVDHWIHFWIDPAFGATTTIKFWTVCNTTTALSEFFGTDGSITESVFSLPNTRLNTIDPATLAPPGSLDGHFIIGIHDSSCPGGGGPNSAIVFAYIESAAIGARQTVLGGGAM